MVKLVQNSGRSLPSLAPRSLAGPVMFLFCGGEGSTNADIPLLCRLRCPTGLRAFDNNSLGGFGLSFVALDLAWESGGNPQPGVPPVLAWSSTGAQLSHGLSPRLGSALLRRHFLAHCTLLTQPPSRTCLVAHFPAHGLRMRASRDIKQRRFHPEVLESKSPMQKAHCHVFGGVDLRLATPHHSPSLSCIGNS